MAANYLLTKKITPLIFLTYSNIMKSKDLKTFFDTINKSSDQVIEILLSAYLLFGIFLAIFYDTWLIALTSGPLILALYFVTKLTFPNKTIHHYVASLGLGIFMAQFIYQMQIYVQGIYFNLCSSNLYCQSLLPNRWGNHENWSR